MRESGRDLKKYIFKVKENDKYINLGSYEDIKIYLSCKINQEIVKLNREINLNGLYDFKNEGFLKNEVILEIKRVLKNA